MVNLSSKKLKKYTLPKKTFGKIGSCTCLISESVSTYSFNFMLSAVQVAKASWMAVENSPDPIDLEL